MVTKLKVIQKLIFQIKILGIEILWYDKCKRP